MESRKRKRWSLAIGLLAVLGIAGFLILSPRPEPTYNGKPLSEWAQQLGPPGWDPEEARPAITAIGTKALPYLVKWVRFEPSYWRFKADSYVKSLPPRLRESRLTQRIVYGDRSRAVAAASAFAVFGPDAGPVIPELEGIFRASTNNFVRANIVFSLRGIGPEAVHALANIAATKAFGSIILTTVDRGRYGTNVDAFTPTLVSYLRGDDIRLARIGALGFTRLQPAPERSVPALIAALERPDIVLRCSVCEALGNYGTQARAALPALDRLYSEAKNGTQLSRAAKVAIMRITGEPPE
ncbi:hypothetical protein GC207_12125 [bacterium]|nr:hypothetical protein [bacterium]